MTELQAQTGVAIGIERIDQTIRAARRPSTGSSLSVPHGSIFALIGENGAGKTTTIQMLLGLMQPDAGRLDVLGLDPTRKGLDVRRRVGYVPEVPVLYDWMTVSEIGWFAAGFHLDSDGVDEHLSIPLQRADPRLRAARAQEDQDTFQRHAGQGLAVTGARVGSRVS